MAEDIKTEIKNSQTAPFENSFPNQTRNCWQNYLDFHHCERAMTAKAGNVLCANDTDMCTSPSAPCPGMTAGQKARFLGRCAFSVLHPSPREVRGGPGYIAPCDPES